MGCSKCVKEFRTIAFGQKLIMEDLLLNIN